MLSSEMLRCVAVIRIDDSKEHSATAIKKNAVFGNALNILASAESISTRTTAASSHQKHHSYMTWTPAIFMKAAYPAS
jgi:hypothetical protein